MQTARRLFMTRLRALVADDDVEVLTLVARALESFGADVVSVTSGGELLEAIANHGRFDVIVTDIMMPWMTGMHVMHSVRTAGSSTPVVVITAQRDPTLRAQVLSLGTHAELLQKPFSIAELYAALRKSLAVAPRGRAAVMRSSSRNRAP
jgi:two-component system copper resistance phosphate regulon response regulator CusR